MTPRVDEDTGAKDGIIGVEVTKGRHSRLREVIRQRRGSACLCVKYPQEARNS